MAEQTDEEAWKLQPKVTKVWEHFTEKKPAKHVKWKLCEAQLSFHGSTTVMHEHLKRRHPGAAVSSRTTERWVHK